MKKRWTGYAAWLMLAACLYFFENNTGTRTILICTLLCPLVPPLRRAFFSADRADQRKIVSGVLTVRMFARRETDESYDVRQYRPGDPVRRIHWKLSAGRDELLVRAPETAWMAEEAERTAPVPADRQNGKGRQRYPLLLAGLILLCGMLLLLMPEARNGTQALCNRVFAASERINAYVYDRFPVPGNQSTALAAALLGTAAAAAAALTVLSRSRAAALCITAVLTLFQVYFGLPFPAWANITLYGLAAILMIRRPAELRSLAAVPAALLLVFLLTAALLPGVDAATEAASETVRDRLSRLAEQITGAVPERPEGETETRHVHTQSLATGDDEARTGREYRLVTVEEEQFSMPHWFNWLKTVLLLLLTAGLVSLPFAPFLILNARKRKATEARKAFGSENVSEAVRAIFRQVVLWLNETGHGAGNLLYREWPDKLPEGLPEGYALRFARCAKDYEEAVYSSHTMPEEKRRQALELLKETETALWKAADRRQRFRIRYWMCLCE